MARLLAAVETERKFGVDEAFVVPELSDLCEVREAGTDLLATTYFDTTDLRLWREGIVLRHRTGGPDAGWHLKAPTRGRSHQGGPNHHDAGSQQDGTGWRGGTSHQDGNGHQGPTKDRLEVRLPPAVGDTETPPVDLLDLVRIVLVGHEVGPRAVVKTERARLLLVGPDGAELAELADDHVVVTAGRHHDSFHELELEDRAGADDARDILAAVADRLGAAGATPPAASSKAVRALGDPADLPPVIPPLPALAPEASAAAAVQAHLLTYTRALRYQDLRVRLDADDAVHQFRVATRRLRSGLRAFRPLFVPGWEAPLADDLRWLARAFAPARDAEVLLDRLVAHAETLPEADRPAVQAFLRRRLGQELAEARNSGLTVLHGSRYLALHQQLLAAASDPATSAAADRPCVEALPPLARRAFGRLVKATGKLDAQASDQTWHKARIAAKRARYAAEACAPALGKPAAKLASRLSHVTDVLGEHQDAVVAAATLARLATAGRVPSRTAYQLGVLHERERAAALAARQAFAGEWRRVVQSKHTHWLDEGT